MPPETGPAIRRMRRPPPPRIICGDCRDLAVVSRLFEGAKANLVITSPPYATQREYDASSGFTPIPPEKYSDWYSAVAASVAAVLAPDGSYFLNIKEHADGAVPIRVLLRWDRRE